MADKTIVITGNYTQFVCWCRDTERSQNDYRWVNNASMLQGVPPGEKVIWLSPWRDCMSPSALERYDELVEFAKAAQLDVEYSRC